MPRLARHCGAPVSLAVVAGLLIAAPASAAAMWTPVTPVEVAPPTLPISPIVRVDAAGDATAIWTAYTDDTRSAELLRASVHPVGGSWSSPVTLPTTNLDPNDVALAVSPGGDAVAAWVEAPGVVRAARRPAVGAWSAPETISDAVADSRDVRLGLDAVGDAVAVFSAEAPMTNSVVDVATMSPAGAWSDPAPISTGDGGSSEPDVAVQPNGAATVVYTQYNTDTTIGEIKAASRSSATAAFGTGVRISDPLATDDQRAASVAVNASGIVAAAWKSGPSSDFSRVSAARRGADGTWGAAADISAAPNTTVDADDVSTLGVVVDPSGASTIAWMRRYRVVDPPPTTTNRFIESASAAASGSWSTTSLLGESTGRGGLDLTVDGAGTATAAWISTGGGYAAVSRRPSAGTWGTPSNLDADDATSQLDVAVAADSAGNLVALWSGSTYVEATDTSIGFVRARAYDADGPLIRSLNVPATGTAGTAASFSVDAADAWSSVASVKWLFSDGGSATGASVTHTYAGPGSYLVSVTVIDANGNARSRTGTIVVAPAPVVVTPPSPATPEPALSGVKLTTKTIHVKGSDEQPQATRLKLTLNTDAAVTLKLKRTKKLHGKVVKAKLVKLLHQGASAVRLTSKLGGKKLPTGTYRVTVTAKNTVGSSKAVLLKLTIVK